MSNGYVGYRTPVIGFLLIVEMPNAGDMRCMAVLLCPIDRVSLSFERGEWVVGVVFDYVVVNVGTFAAALEVAAQYRRSPYLHLLAWPTQLRLASMLDAKKRSLPVLSRL